MLELTTETRGSTAGDMIREEAWTGNCKCGAFETADFGRLETYRRYERFSGERITRAHVGFLR